MAEQTVQSGFRCGLHLRRLRMLSATRASVPPSSVQPAVIETHPGPSPNADIVSALEGRENIAHSLTTDTSRGIVTLVTLGFGEKGESV